MYLSFYNNKYIHDLVSEPVFYLDRQINTLFILKEIQFLSCTINIIIQQQDNRS